MPLQDQQEEARKTESKAIIGNICIYGEVRVYIIYPSEGASTGMFRVCRCLRDSSSDPGGTAQQMFLLLLLLPEVVAVAFFAVDALLSCVVATEAGSVSAGSGDGGGTGVAEERLNAMVRPKELEDPKKCHSCASCTPAACLPWPEARAAVAASLGKGPGCKAKISSGQLSRVSHLICNSPLVQALLG